MKEYMKSDLLTIYDMLDKVKTVISYHETLKYFNDRAIDINSIKDIMSVIGTEKELDNF
tara:strand:- start:163 stop:339 length:177 start_codon:yes stop_codon:yes gene_type:complete